MRRNTRNQLYSYAMNDRYRNPAPHYTLKFIPIIKDMYITTQITHITRLFHLTVIKHLLQYDVMTVIDWLFDRKINQDLDMS